MMYVEVLQLMMLVEYVVEMDQVVFMMIPVLFIIMKLVIVIPMIAMMYAEEVIP